jgi:glycosyltransferase involved in cell wall biosynthesis
MSKTGHHRQDPAQGGGPPGVSVIVPAYNAERTIDACLRSVQAAEYAGSVEIIVADDGSTDATPAIARRLGANVVPTDRNSGPAQARNAGARHATGDILLFVDADTRMRRDTITAAVHALQRPGVGAVSGMYEAEPINAGFFPRYYAYLKYYAYTLDDVDHINVFSGQCGAIHKTLFDRVGGYRSMAWGVDIENEELGYRINKHAEIALSRAFRVAHNFPGLRKLLFVFNNRVYWWILFKQFSRKDETVLMTRGFGYATAALPLAATITALASAAGPSPWAAAGYASACILLAWFVSGYAGFWRFCAKQRGPAFAVAGAMASAIFAFVITFGAARGYLAVARTLLTRRPPPFIQPALGSA